MDNLKDRFGALSSELQAWLIELSQVGQPQRTPARRRHKTVRKIENIEVKAVPIMLAVCKTLNLSAVRLKSPERTSPFTAGRYMSFNLLTESGYTCTVIGRLFNRDHSTVLHGLDMHNDLMFGDKEYKNKYHRICDTLKILPRKGFEREVANA